MSEMAEHTAARLVAHPEPGKVWVQIPHHNDIGSDWIAVDELASVPPTQPPAAPETETDANGLLAAATSPGVDRCGAWGGCPLPSGHNTGQADLPENHPAAAESDANALWALSTPSLWESPDARSIPTLLAAIGQVLQRPSAALDALAAAGAEIVRLRELLGLPTLPADQPREGANQ